MFTENQLKELAKPIDPKRVSKDNKGFSHLEAWDVRRRLTEIFGHGGWSTEIRSVDQVSESDSNGKWTVIYRVHGTLVIDNVIYEDVAVGGAVNQPSRVDAHDNALKSAASGALKRCAVNLGDQFGLSLYNHGSTKQVVNAPYDGAVAERSAAENQKKDISVAIIDLASATTKPQLTEKWAAVNVDFKNNLYTDSQWKTFAAAVEKHKNRILKLEASQAEANLDIELETAQAGGVNEV
jgi:recombination DNA repair RAD52 pathway protein